MLVHLLLEFIFLELRSAEVAYLASETSIRVEHDIFWLEIVVYNVFEMHVRHTGTDLRCGEYK